MWLNMFYAQDYDTDEEDKRMVEDGTLSRYKFAIVI